MKTIRVRIAVAVASNEHWNAEGWSRTDKSIARDSDMVQSVKNLFGNFNDNNVSISFIEADVPIPESQQTIEGEVK